MRSFSVSSKLSMVLALASVALTLQISPAIAQDSAPASAVYYGQAFQPCQSLRALATEPSTKQLLTCLNHTWEPTPLKRVSTLKDTPSEYMAVYMRADGTCVKETSRNAGALTGVIYDYPLRVKSWSNIHQPVACRTKAAYKGKTAKKSKKGPKHA